MKYHFIAIVFVIFSGLSFCLSGGVVNEQKDFVVVLDPGHGGKDHGAPGLKTNEKTINLDVAKKVRDLLKGHKGIKVVMTRDTDRFVELQERASIANKHDGDLFVSIHVNSVAKSNKRRKTISGASVYVLGLHRSASNFEVAKRENSVIELEADYTTQYQGFDPSSTESYIMFELSQSEHLAQSISFAELAEDNLCSTAGRRRFGNGVQQAGFWVLHASAMPAVLIELDFICNPNVEKYLASDKGKNQMAKAIADAIVAYSGAGMTTLTIDVPGPQEQEPSPCPEDVTGPEAVVADSDAITYRVQFIAVERSLPSGSSEFKGLKNVEEYRQGGLYKYTVGGDFATEEEAEKYARKHIKKKFPQAFVIKWQNGTRIM